MGNVNMEAYQVHFEGKSVADKLKELDAVAQQIEDLPTFTSNDRVFLESVPAMPTEEGKKVLTATTDGQGNTDLTYETPDVEWSDIAPVFDDTAAYSDGDLVYYDGVLYKFDADHTAGAWDPTEVTQTSVAAEFNQLKNTLTAHTVGTRVDISGYTSSNVYTCPSDGYLIAINFSEANDGYICVEYQTDSGFSIGQGIGRFSVYVKKGMQVYVVGTLNYAMFCPLL